MKIIDIHECVLEAKRKKVAVDEKYIQAQQQSGIRKLNEGANQNYHNLNGYQEIDL